MSLENRPIDYGDKGFSWTNESMHINVPELIPFREKTLNVNASVQDARDSIYPAYVRLTEGVRVAHLWALSHSREIALTGLVTSLALGAIYELSHPDITSALQDPMYPSCDTIPGAVLQPDQTHGIYGGVCQIQSTPQHYFIDGSQLSLPSEAPAATSTTYSQSTVVYENPASNTPASPFSTPYIPETNTNNSGNGAIFALVIGGSIAGLSLFRGFLRRSFGTYQSPQEAYDEGIKKGLELGGVVKKESEAALAKQLEKERKKALKRRGIR